MRRDPGSARAATTNIRHRMLLGLQNARTKIEMPLPGQEGGIGLPRQRFAVSIITANNAWGNMQEVCVRLWCVVLCLDCPDEVVVGWFPSPKGLSGEGCDNPTGVCEVPTQCRRGSTA